MDTAKLPLIGGPSARVRLAQLAERAALDTPGVAGLDAGPAGMFCTVGGGQRIGGVSCAIAPEGGFDLSLRLVCELVPMREAAEHAREAIESAAAEEQLELRSVTITVTDVVDVDVDVVAAEPVET